MYIYLYTLEIDLNWYTQDMLCLHVTINKEYKLRLSETMEYLVMKEEGRVHFHERLR